MLKAMHANTIDRMGWREKFALARKAKGITQDELCKLTGFGQNTLSALESGESYPNLKTLLNAAGKVEVDLAWLFSDTPDCIPSDDEKAARKAFEAKMQAIGPKRMLDLMVASGTEWARDLGAVDLPQSVGHDEAPDRPGHPAVPGPVVPSPKTSGGPPEVEFRNVPSKPDSLSSSKGKRKPR